MSDVPRATLRQLLSQCLRTASDLDAFILDYFPSVYRRFGGGMDRTQRENLLLTLAEPSEILSALRSGVSPDLARQIDAVLRSASAASEPEPAPTPTAPPTRDVPVTTKPPLLFLAHADEDEATLRALETHLLPHERSGRLRIFHRGRVKFGFDVRHDYLAKLAEATVIVPLLSADLLGSETFEPLLHYALQRQQAGALIVPLIVRAVSWEQTAIGRLKALPADGRPLSTRTRTGDRDAELTRIAATLIQQLGSVRAQPTPISDFETQPPRSPSAQATEPRSASAQATEPRDTPTPSRTTAAAAGLPASYILHLSDLHFSSAAQLHPFLERLEADLDELRSQVPAIHGIVVSGDLTTKATPAEFKVAADFLHELGTTLSCSQQQMVLVPGNHDGSWDLSRAAYAPGVPEQAPPAGVEPISPEAYSRRFEAFAECYREVVGSPYPLPFAEQATLHAFPAQKLLFLGLNSAWQCDHLVPHRGRAAIHDGALSVALRSLRREKKYEDWLKIAVFHHPVHSDGEDRIKNTGFLDRLTQAGFRLALHGHMHAAQQIQHAYDSTQDGRKLRVVGAGTFGAPTREWRAGVPLQYQILCVSGARVTVRSRCRSNPEGVWQGDGRWTVGNDVRSFYEINL